MPDDHLQIEISADGGETYAPLRCEVAPKTIISKQLIDKFQLLIDGPPIVLSPREAITIYAWSDILQGPEVYISNGEFGNKKLMENNMLRIYVKVVATWFSFCISQEYLLNASLEDARAMLLGAITENR